MALSNSNPNMQQLEKLNYHAMNLTLKIKDFINNFSFYKSWIGSVTIFEIKYDVLTIINPANLSIGGYYCKPTKTLILTIPFLEISIGNKEVAITNFINIYMDCLSETLGEKCINFSQEWDFYDEREKCKYSLNKNNEDGLITFGIGLPATKKIVKKKSSKSKARKIHGEPTTIQTELKLGKIKSKKKFKK